MRDPEFIELRNRFLFGLLISIFIGGLLFLFFYRSYKVQGNDIYKSINKDKVIVFVEDNNCSKCVEIHHLLDTNKYKYVTYNKDSNNSIEKILRLDYYGLGVPSLIYLENGRVVSFMNSLDDNSEINDFFEQYGGA